MPLHKQIKHTYHHFLKMSISILTLLCFNQYVIAQNNNTENSQIELNANALEKNEQIIGSYHNSKLLSPKLQQRDITLNQGKLGKASSYNLDYTIDDVGSNSTSSNLLPSYADVLGPNFIGNNPAIRTHIYYMAPFYHSKGFKNNQYRHDYKYDDDYNYYDVR
jgi:hypothetical protein